MLCAQNMSGGWRVPFRIFLQRGLILGYLVSIFLILFKDVRFVNGPIQLQYPALQHKLFGEIKLKLAKL